MNQLQLKSSSNIIFFFAIACGSLIANLYYSQPLLLLISHTINLNQELNGLISTLTQLGYGLGLFLLVPLADIIENKRLIISLLFLNIISLAGLILFKNSLLFISLSFILGLSSVAVQVFVPLASYMATAENRGIVVGKVMSGLLLGIMFARPLASFLAELFTWQAIYIFSFILMTLILVLSFKLVPIRHPQAKISYPSLIFSIFKLFITTPILRRRSIYQFVMFGVFILFWTVVPQVLLGKTFNLSNYGVAIFALIGVAGAIAAPIAGRLADRGFIRIITFFAFAATIISFIIIGLIELGSTSSLLILTAAGFVIDGAVSITLISGQKEIFSLDEKNRSRYGAIYTGVFFMGGALGSSVGSYIYHRFGWSTVILTSISILIATILYFLTEPSIVTRDVNKKLNL